MIPAAAEVPVETRQEFIGAARELVEMQVTGLEEVIIELQKRREAELLEEKEGPRELKREEFLKRQARDKAMTFETLLAHCGDMIAGFEAADWLSATRLAHLPETGTLSAAETARALVQPLVLVERWVREGRIPTNREGRVPIPDVVRIGARLSCYRLEARADVEKGLAQALRPPRRAVSDANGPRRALAQSGTIYTAAGRGLAWGHTTRPFLRPEEAPMRKSMYPILILVILGGRALAQETTSTLAASPQCSLTTFDVPGSDATAPNSINEDGAITGFYVGSEGGYHGFLREKDGTIITFDVPAAAYTTPSSINGAGAITGSYRGNGFSRGFLREKHGTIITFDVPGAAHTVPLSINEDGAITGYYVVSNGGNGHGFVRTCRDQ
jgi:hypothetical protein